MNRIIRSFAGAGFCGAALCALTPAGFAQPFYFEADGGVALAEKVDLRRFITPTPGTRLKFDPGARFSVAGGININDYFGAQVETGFIYNNVDSVTGGFDIDASLSHVPLMTDLVFRYDRPDCNWVPFAGAGLGGDLSVLTLDHVVAPGGSVVDGEDTTLVFAWQAFVGFRYKFNHNMSIGADYKFYWADKASWDVENTPGDIKIDKALVHSFGVSFNMKF